MKKPREKLFPFPAYFYKGQLKTLDELSAEKKQSIAKEIRDAVDEHIASHVKKGKEK